MNIKRYGIDAPFALLIYAVFGVGLLWHAYVNRWNYPIGIEMTIGIILLLGALVFLHTTAQGKYRLFDEAIKHLNIKPDSQVLDLGCGRGALLTRIAQQLGPAGKVTGLDLWLSRDQSHNKLAVTQKNVDELGLTDRVNLVTGDMTKLDFPDASFDLVTSSFAIHNIKNEQARINAVKEAIRVLKPGGHIMIIDTGRNINEYGQVFQDAGLQITQSMGLGFNGWWATPLTDSYVVAGNKPTTKTAE
ncbi:class I SAM-dependent methyltransferase [Lactiplantibacillus plantarum]|uniref:class I SAM-dependent methyltransferase n=1 Tax=Lactiplantibacillus plantarum TaxID=1590 RepID=UPI001FBBAE81|nr:class I SAM-dependent methyltransferase [Lactiplantibacillus plantarum]MBO2707232.1 methyltransferase domain-containing protein [Lactiplantibacillus plantarum]MCT0194414.1 methyltransferase domain-containing protein [Lactiplantibacillus plantarum]